jgi:hypothetical protein
MATTMKTARQEEDMLECQHHANTGRGPVIDTIEKIGRFLCHTRITSLFCGSADRTNIYPVAGQSISRSQTPELTSGPDIVAIVCQTGTSATTMMGPTGQGKGPGSFNYLSTPSAVYFT